MYEGMLHECVVITEKLPDREYYEGIPVIQVDKWKDGVKIARELLKDKPKLLELAKLHKKFYEERLHPRVTAAGIAKIISERC